MAERLLTPSKITAWLGCEHSLTLSNLVDAGELLAPRGVLSELAQVLVDKGAEHEASCLDDYEALGRTIYEVPGRNREETFEAWVERVGNPMSRGVDVIYQMPFIHEGIRGIADFLVRVDAPGEGFSTYEPVDAKLTRTQGKPGHVLQLCFYAEAITALTGAPPQFMHLWLGSGTTQALLVEEFLPYWRRLRRQLERLLDATAPATSTVARPCDTCEYCEFFHHCDAQWRREDALAYVANSRPEERDALEAAGVRTLVELATREGPVERVREEKLDRLVRQAALQVASRERPDMPPAFSHVAASDDPIYGHGFEALPAPDEGDVFFDFEGDPFWTAQHDLMFLAGLYYERDGEMFYDERWAHSLGEQQTMIKGLVEFFAERRERFPGAHVYHYNHTERSTIERLTRDVEDENLFASLVESGLFVDLYVVARNAVQVGTESYGLKHLERLVRFERSGGIDQGAGAVVEYEGWLKSRDPAVLTAIASYNRDDVAATKALRDWLVAQRPADLAWRDTVFTKETYELDTDELVEGLHAFEPDSSEYLLGDLLNYWRRERSADVTPKFVALNGDYSSLYDNAEYIVNLSYVRTEEPVGRERNARYVFTWPVQDVDPSFAEGPEILFAGPGVPYGHGRLSAVDVQRRELSIPWGAVQSASGSLPTALTRDRYFRPGAKASALKDLARQMLWPDEHGDASRLARALLARELPRFVEDRGPQHGVFRDDLTSIYEWVEYLDESFVAVQGPPGTGKTYSGSHLIHHLIKRGLRVGVVAMNHAAIDNLMSATERVFNEAGDRAILAALRWQNAEGDPALDFATYSTKKDDLASGSFNLIGGTAWLWANDTVRQYPVDVLVVDEAGQLALADAVASTNGARNMILLGDPLQLSQVAKAEHPGTSGSSVLEHLLDGAMTISDSHGVFISQTWRMHPDVCRFISRQIYEGRLTSHESCARQATAFGTGLRWLETHHVGRSTLAEEESDLVAAQIGAMLDSPWTDRHGVTAPLHAHDFMVVAPYNDQVNLLRERFGSSRQLRGVQVGTVDKFQGREAPVVFFTMTTSSAADMPRGPEFLFSRNRLNVAVSRARCLAYLVCTEELLNSRAHDLEDMRLISTLSAFVEYARDTP